MPSLFFKRKTVVIVQGNAILSCLGPRSVYLLYSLTSELQAALLLNPGDNVCGDNMNSTEIFSLLKIF